LTTEVTDEMLCQSARSPEHLKALQSLDIRSALTAPLVAHGRSLGAIQLIRCSSSPFLNDTDLRIANTLAARAAAAVENAQLYEREREVANAFQRAALPISLPHIPGITFDDVYEPGKSEAQVGGDWYDALRLADGRILISLGDVAGSGLSAAVIMASMRQVIRGVAQVYADPATLIDAADRTLKAEHPDWLVTAFVGVFDPIAHILSYVSAGHPPPFLRRPNGEVVALESVGLPLGLRLRNEADTRSVDVELGSVLLFYTDGLTESSRDVVEGELQVMTALSQPEIALDEHPAKALYHRILHQGAHDDVVVLSMRFGLAPQSLSKDVRYSTPYLYSWSFHTDEVHKGQAARLEFAQLLRDGHCSEADVFNSEIIFGELLGNVVRYAPGDVDIFLDWNVGSRPTLHFLDKGPGFIIAPMLPTDILNERGRGLFLVWTLSHDFNVTKRTIHGSHARAVLPGEIRK
jgi:serine phosphatase RsbU (regulator of sigma subunit)